MTDAFVSYNGKIYLISQVPVDVNNRAFKYGDSFFETIRANGQYPLHFSIHYKRVVKAMLSLKMELASIPREEELMGYVCKLLQKQKCFGPSRVRISFFRRGKGLYTPETNQADFFIEASPLANASYQLNEKGLLVSVYSEMKKCYNPTSFFKCGNSMHYVLAALQKKQERVDDCLLINLDDKIVEACSSNLFWIKDGVLRTPSVFAGCVDGVMRKLLLDLIVKEKLFRIEETQGAAEEELLNADEIFLTNAIQGVQWVVGFKDKRYFNQHARMLTNKLNEYTFD